MKKSMDQRLSDLKKNGLPPPILKGSRMRRRRKLIYYRRKGKQIIAEGQTVHYGKKKTVYLFTLPPIEKLLKSSLFTQEKAQQILEKITRLKNIADKGSRSSDNKDYTNFNELKKEDG